MSAVQLLIAPAPSPSNPPASAAPAPPAPKPTTTTTTKPTLTSTPTASVSTTPTIPVKVVDDPGPDGVAIAGLVFAILAFVVGTIASAFSIVLAQRAAGLAKQASEAAVTAAQEAERANEEASKARAAVADERRRTFELEVLRDLLELTEEFKVVSEIAKSPARITKKFGGRLAVLPVEDLPFWRELRDVDPYDLPELLGEPTPAELKQIDQARRINIYSPAAVTIERLTARLRQDVLDAIERRMAARDD